MWLNIGGTNFSSFDGGFSGDGAGGDNYTSWFFCGEAAKKKNKILEQIVGRVKFGDSYQQGIVKFKDLQRADPLIFKYSCRWSVRVLMWLLTPPKLNPPLRLQKIIGRSLVTV